MCAFLLQLTFRCYTFMSIAADTSFLRRLNFPLFLLRFFFLYSCKACEIQWWNLDSRASSTPRLLFYYYGSRWLINSITYWAPKAEKKLTNKRTRDVESIANASRAQLRDSLLPYQGLFICAHFITNVDLAVWWKLILFFIRWKFSLVFLFCGETERLPLPELLMQPMTRCSWKSIWKWRKEWTKVLVENCCELTWFSCLCWRKWRHPGGWILSLWKGKHHSAMMFLLFSWLILRVFDSSNARKPEFERQLSK